MVGQLQQEAETGITPEILQKMKELSDSLSPSQLTKGLSTQKLQELERRKAWKVLVIQSAEKM